MITIRGNWDSLSTMLPTILAKLAEAVHSDLLKSRCEKWQTEHREYQQFLADLENSSDEPARSRKKPTKPTDEPVEPPPVQKTTSAIPGQNIAVEKLINDILGQLPAGVAGDIRQAIAKSGNKLQALQAELAKRRISI